MVKSLKGFKQKSKISGRFPGVCYHSNRLRIHKNFDKCNTYGQVITSNKGNWVHRRDRLIEVRH